MFDIVLWFVVKEDFCGVYVVVVVFVLLLCCKFVYLDGLLFVVLFYFINFFGKVSGCDEFVVF